MFCSKSYIRRLINKRKGEDDMKKKVLSILLTLTMTLSLLTAFGISASAETGDSETDPILIHSYQELGSFASNVNNGSQVTSGKFFKLADDFPENSETTFKTPIGNTDHPFQGNFDGNGKEVCLKISIEGGSAIDAGLFGNNEGTVKKSVFPVQSAEERALVTLQLMSAVLSVIIPEPLAIAMQQFLLSAERRTVDLHLSMPVDLSVLTKVPKE